MNSPPQIIRSTRTCLSVQDYSLMSGQRQSWSAGDNYNLTPPASPTPPREKHTLELQRQLQVPPPPLRKQPQYRDLGTDSDRIHFPSVGDEVGPALPRKRPLTLRPLARRPLSRQPLSMRPLPRLPRPDDARLSSSFVSLSCSLDGGAQEHVCMETDASDGGSIGSFGFLLDEDQDGGPAADDGNFLFDEDQAAEDENTHAMEVCAPAPIQVAASPLGAKDGGCLSRSPSSIMFFDHFTY
mmetsp:Transcript_36225/g.71317  ORF Transcript_36225/g.71317 Transcript_36225/m.71317 type:complete len:240 (+) Transcript_36225:141-860(+)